METWFYNLGQSIGTLQSKIKQYLENVAFNIGNKIGILQNATEGFFNDLAFEFGKIIGTLRNNIKSDIEEIFVPDAYQIGLRVAQIRNRFAFVEDVANTFGYIVGYIDNAVSKVPSIKVNLNNTETEYNYGSGEIEVINLNWYVRYKPYADTVIVGFTYIWFFMTIYRRLPDIISGAGAVVNNNKGDK